MHMLHRCSTRPLPPISASWRQEVQPAHRAASAPSEGKDKHADMDHDLESDKRLGANKEYLQRGLHQLPMRPGVGQKLTKS